MASRLIQLVNQGADHIETGRLRSAVCALNGALQDTKKILEERQQQNQVIREENNPKRRRLSNSMSSEQRATTVIATTSKLRKFTQTIQTGQQQFTMYTKPLRITIPRGSLEISSFWSEENQAASSAFFHALIVIVLFNLALAQHVNAVNIRTPINRHTHLKRALELYNLCHERKTKHKVSLNSIANMGLINNIGLIYDEMGNKHVSSRFFDFLLSHCVAEQACLHHANQGRYTQEQQSYSRIFRTNAATHQVRNGPKCYAGAA